MYKIKKPSSFENIEHRFNSHTLNEILPYLPDEDCFFDTRHWTCDTTNGIMPFAVTTDIVRNAQQFLKIMKVVEPLNADDLGLCRPLKAQYYKNGRANFLKSDGGTFAATGVLEKDITMSEIKHIGQMSSSQNSRVIDPEGISYAVTNGHKDGEPKIATSYRIRKLTPRECFRLMGVEDKDIDTIQASGVSNSQQYKMAGNSIVVDCLYHLFRKMFTETQSEDRQLTLF